MTLMTLQEINHITELAKPLIQYINENLDPHHKIIIENDSIEVLQSSGYNVCNEFIKD